MFNQNKQKKPSKIGEGTKKLFRFSTPYGYLPSDVEKQVEQFIILINKYKETVAALKNENANLKGEIASLERLVSDLKMEMNFIQVPEVQEIQKEYIAKKFDEKLNDGKGNKISTEELDVLEQEPQLDKETEDILDSLSDLPDVDGDGSIDEDIFNLFTPELNNKEDENKNDNKDDDDVNDDNYDDFMKKYGF